MGFLLCKTFILIRIFILSNPILALVAVRFGGTGCIFNNRILKEGQPWIAGDGCSQCVCQGINGIRCDNSACKAGRFSRYGCIFNNRILKEGETSIADDGCSRCVCHGSDRMRCDNSACAAALLDPNQFMSDGTVTRKQKSNFVAERLIECSCEGFQQINCDGPRCDAGSDEYSCFFMGIDARRGNGYFVSGDRNCFCLRRNVVSCSVKDPQTYLA